ncbi:MAG: hypothetical protein JSW11_17160 [Candidatus Heimdallarchaeota archaeon]|nr:MAG: hypothetical protein JSW11_17160 [Candidatus Heimdallarchaeota archaeon]
MNIPKNLLEIKEYVEEGYKPVVDYGAWRVAILNFIDELLPENIDFMSKHDETDEVFVLLKGNCLLFIGEGNEMEITKLYAQNMVPYKIYNVKRGVWHNHVLSRDAMVLIVENQDTTESNSPIIKLTKKQKEQIIDLTTGLGR